MKVLIVEDEAKIASFVSKGLKEAGFIVDCARNGDDGYHMATTGSYDALVLDIMLPGLDGISILKKIRSERHSIPIILLTARSELNDKLNGLNEGADDYLTKPFYIEELIARLHVVTRRSSGNELSILKIGELTANLITREVFFRSRAVELTDREFTLLTYLMRSPGRVFTRTQICEHVWNYHFDPGTNIIDVYIQRLRKKLGLRSSQIIETVRGVGYRIHERLESA
ncbi:MAG: response regulator transcription factor [Verrucomicrobia bacterium]|jgi:DNA-binding response OmpR family regulator|nr:response regulator transcription factor [Verrucomicrobiota bacterium]MBT5061197.1 response regulator transcription factor [Verrucomicrobiota bacterium]MBT5380483.1 response regulator transcription factor [Opitutae bacterium]MBT7851956.1 response regulator transcription factor [Opitutae bacterium]